MNSSHLRATSMLGTILSAFPISAIEFSGRLSKVNAPVTPSLQMKKLSPKNVQQVQVGAKIGPNSLALESLRLSATPAGLAASHFPPTLFQRAMEYWS